MDYTVYQNPLTGRYAGTEMSFNWSPQKKHSTWRRLWLMLATEEKALGLDISDEQIREMAAHLDDIDFEVAAAKEKELRHDVMSHIHTFGLKCPAAMPIIHLGATSCYVTDNTELIQMRDGMAILRKRLIEVIRNLNKFILQYKDMPTLGFTHYQPAQLTTVGKRFALYLQDFIMDFEKLEYEMSKIPFRSIKGTTGTQASFLALFNGDHEKVKTLELRVAKAMGFENIVSLSGQTYTRKVDYNVLTALSGLAQSAYKMCGDIRLLANLREIEEPFGKNQVGSSAMAYKRNPMRSERVCSLARYLMSLPINCAHTHSTQWFERTLDDSANRRLVLPEAFLTADIILSTVANVTSGLQVWPNVIARRVAEELPFMATENILMAAVKAGGNRQDLHEAIRIHSMEAARRVKEEGAANDLIDRIKNDDHFAVIKAQIDELIDARAFVGRAPEQCLDFLNEQVAPILEKYQDVETGSEELQV
ncbi:MAG: adenylosuccinate lyase [Victivallaceae bacterium]|nr:adenylosuccinate lyase [Victivallaceae bacterium]NLK83385.1 adenylosuccinate lyase [Lentisphaerota bacterium]MDD3116508.1 adenylosuccinate lyase [Victivallaceae bacterium]MDD3704192.1 adenylosuccinate lyase [Victivallaceae bacterium]MDD4317770.1 adenylosuccinate lyase [Victivallaceae bacterium]